MDKLKSKLIEYHEMLDVIRVRRKTDFSVETLKNALKISRVTADKFLSELLGEAIIKKEEKHYIINSDIAYFLGISIGSKHTRLHLIDLNFDSLPLNKIKEYSCLSEMETFGELVAGESEDDGFCFKTLSTEGNAFNQVQQLVSKIIAVFLQQAEKDSSDGAKHFPLAGIGIAVTGPVNYTEAKWCSAPEHLTKIKNISLAELIGYDNLEKARQLGIFLSLDNNAKTAMISEYQYLLEKELGNYNKDIALLYMGSGVGSSAVLGKALLRGSQNLSGEIGFLRTESQKTVDERMRAMQSLDEEEQEKESFHILTFLCNVINCVLGIDRVILVGHSIRQHNEIITKLLERRMEFTVASTQHYCRPEKGRGVAGTAAIGAAIEAYMSMCHFDDSSPEKWTNLATDISWM